MYIGTGSCLHQPHLASFEYLLNDAGNKNKGINLGSGYELSA